MFVSFSPSIFRYKYFAIAQLRWSIGGCIILNTLIGRKVAPFRDFGLRTFIHRPHRAPPATPGRSPSPPEQARDEQADGPAGRRTPLRIVDEPLGDR
jgi:hypothetical protein